MLINCLAVGAGGFIGSVLRYLVGCVPLLGKNGMPLSTLLVNVIGAVLIGMIVGFSERHIYLSGEMMLFLKVGLCGGFTTFSTFALESAEFVESGRPAMAGAYIVMSILLCVLGIYLGKNLIIR